MKPLIRFTLLITLLAVLAGSGGNLLGQGNAFTFQGLLRDSNGPVTTIVSIQFRLYATPSGGVAVWQETLPSIPVTNGLFAGRDDKTISTLEADGVALAAIQGLNQKLEEKLSAKEAHRSLGNHRCPTQGTDHETH